MGSYIRAASLGGFEDLVRSYGINPIEVLNHHFSRERKSICNLRFSLISSKQ
jgi:hypothetical protein